MVTTTTRQYRVWFLLLNPVRYNKRPWRTKKRHHYDLWKMRRPITTRMIIVAVRNHFVVLVIDDSRSIDYSPSHFGYPQYSGTVGRSNIVHRRVFPTIRSKYNASQNSRCGVCTGVWQRRHPSNTGLFGYPPLVVTTKLQPSRSAQRRGSQWDTNAPIASSPFRNDWHWSVSHPPVTDESNHDHHSIVLLVLLCIRRFINKRKQYTIDILYPGW